MKEEELRRRRNKEGGMKEEEYRRRNEGEGMKEEQEWRMRMADEIERLGSLEG